jgi:hypothetical protein
MIKEVAMRSMNCVGILVLLGLAGIGGPARADKADAPPATKTRDYELRIIRVGNTFQGVRFKVSTGESWSMEGDKWTAIPETGQVAAGDFDVTLVTDDTNWMAFRIDRLSGAAWQLRGNKWRKVKEPDDKSP